VPTLEDVAKRAGVSTATVSKVLSNTPYFTDATRDKVMRAVEELSYVPNLAARALSSGKTRIIAVVFPFVYEPLLTDPNVVGMAQGIEAECSAHSYNILLSTPHLLEDGPDSQYQQLLQSGYLDGVIAIDSYPLASCLDPVRARDIPAVALGHDPHDCYVRHDDRDGGEQIMRHVIDLGHERIGLISVPENINYGISERLEGMRAVTDAAGLDLDRFPMAYGDWSIESGATAAAAILDQHPEITALMCLNDRMAMGAIQQARAMGRSVPHDLSVTGYDDIPSAAVFAPSITTINQKARTQGQAAARMLFDLLNGQPAIPVKLRPELVVRESSIREGSTHRTD
jgi:DNA-binding LacI/PurR family transcriptional regulator